jgi:hypothetical protein
MDRIILPIHFQSELENSSLSLWVRISLKYLLASVSINSLFLFQDLLEISLNYCVYNPSKGFVSQPELYILSALFSSTTVNFSFKDVLRAYRTLPVHPISVVKFLLLEPSSFEPNIDRIASLPWFLGYILQLKQQ